MTIITYNVDFDKLMRSLNYLHVSELKNHCETFLLSAKGKKNILVLRIVHFFRTGVKIDAPEYPEISIARGRRTNDLKPNVLMLKGNYKNDLRNRIYCKNLIGEYFHFTAFGIDWLEERWMQGQPPTYQEFAYMWKKEYAFRKENGSISKAEWAYINCVKNYLSSNPNASREEILRHWESERNYHKDWINQFITEYRHDFNKYQILTKDNP